MNLLKLGLSEKSDEFKSSIPKLISNHDAIGWVEIPKFCVKLNSFISVGQRLLNRSLTRLVISSMKSMVASLVLVGIIKRKERNSRCKAINETASKCFPIFLSSKIQKAKNWKKWGNIFLGSNLCQRVLVKLGHLQLRLQ